MPLRRWPARRPRGARRRRSARPAAPAWRGTSPPASDSADGGSPPPAGRGGRGRARRPARSPQLELREQAPATSLGGQLAVAGAPRQVEDRRRQGTPLSGVAGLHQHDEPTREDVAERGRIADALRHRDRLLAQLVAPRIAARVGQLAREAREQPGAQRAVGGVERVERLVEQLDSRAVRPDRPPGRRPAKPSAARASSGPRAAGSSAARWRRRVLERAARRLERPSPLPRFAEVDEQLAAQPAASGGACSVERLQRALAQTRRLLVGQPARRLGRRAARVLTARSTSAPPSAASRKWCASSASRRCRPVCCSSIVPTRRAAPCAPRREGRRRALPGTARARSGSRPPAPRAAVTMPAATPRRAGRGAPRAARPASTRHRGGARLHS